MLHTLRLRQVGLILCETVIVPGAVYLAAFIRLGDREWELFFEDLPKACARAAWSTRSPRT